MRLLISIPVLDQFELGRISLAQWDYMTSDRADFLLIDNGSQCDWQRWLQTAHLRDCGRWHYLRNDRNVGVVRSSQQAYQWAADRGYDLLALTHNDLWVFQEMWDQRLAILFDNIAHLGGVGFFGSKGCSLSGHRLETFGNVLDHGHGRRMTKPYEPACVFDGFFQCYSMAMLKSLRHECVACDKGEDVKRYREDRSIPRDAVVLCGVCGGEGQHGGFDQRYQWMHIYDYDFSLESIHAGWKNAVLNVPCHHLSGLTANNDAAPTSGEDIMAANIARFHQKWDDRLGVTVNGADWTYTWGQR